MGSAPGGARLVLVLVAVDIALFERNRGVQAELTARQQLLQQTGQLRS